MKFYLISLLTIIALCCSCNGTADKQAATDRSEATENKNTATDERVKEALTGYWNNYDFADTTSSNRAEGEQRFANFLMLLSYADSAVAHEAVARYIERGYAKPELRTRYDVLINHYLEHPESPMRNDAIFLHFLACELQHIAHDDEAARKRIEFKIKMAAKNLPGSIAPDFDYTDRKGNCATLHKTKAPLTLIIFNDPDCDNCKKMLPRLKREPMFNRSEVKVVMVYPDEETQAWMAKGDSVPTGWIDACSPGGAITNEQLYHIPAMPSLYLLDENKRVILKDAHPRMVVSAIKNLLTENDIK
jgi:hypothetical protein